MLGTFKQRCAAVMCGLLAVAALGAPSVARADDDVAVHDVDKAMLTKVIDAPEGTDASADTYTFHFAGGGEVAEGNTDAGQNRDKVYADGVEQDGATLKIGDIVPSIPDVRLKGVEFNSENSLSNGQLSQTVVQKSIASILTENGVTFPHAGVYTYVVTEISTHTALTDGTYVNASQAEYVLRIRVSNKKTEEASELTNRELEVEGVTIEQKKNDNGDETNGEKIDPEYPKATAAGKITETAQDVTPDENQLVGDARGREVDGFTFANEYIKGGSFQVKKLYDGAHSDRTKYSSVELVVYSAAAANPNAHGACLTYRIEGDGIDTTENNQDGYGEHLKLNGIYSDIPQTNDYMATFDDRGWVRIKADLKEDSIIRITGEFGPYNPEYADDPTSVDGNKRMILSQSGLLQGQTFYVIERYPGDYIPTGYVHSGEGEADPRVSEAGMTATQRLTSDIADPTDYPPSAYDNNPDAYQGATIKAGCLVVQGDASGEETTVFVVNALDETNVSPTGILINNLPYILMVGVPLAAFVVMFVSRRRKALAA